MAAPCSSPYDLKLISSDPFAQRTSVASVDLDVAASELERAAEAPVGTFSAATLRPRLAGLTGPTVREGFFADAVVIVEGEEDAALLTAAAHRAGHDLGASGIAIVPVGGKSNIDRVLVIFRQLGKPTYVCFDGDASQRDHADLPDPHANERLLGLLGADPVQFPQTQITGSWACFEDTFQAAIDPEFGVDEYRAAINTAREQLGFVKGGAKNSGVIARALEILHESGLRSPTLDSLVANIADMGSRAVDSEQASRSSGSP